MTFEAFLTAVEAGDREVVLEEISLQPAFCDRRDTSGVRALMRARYNGHNELAVSLAEESEPLDLFEAAAIGNTGRISSILESLSPDVNAVSPDGFPPLALASFFGNHESVQVLLGNGADPNRMASNPSSVRPLHSAVANRDEDTSLAAMRLLLEAGADPNTVQAGGYTPLHSAAAHGREKIVELLLKFNADPGVLCNDMLTPANMARQNGHEGIASYLESKANN